MSSESSPEISSHKASSQSSLRWLLVLLGLGVLIRVALLLTYSPIEYGDSGSYLRLGEAMLGIGERGYDGTRVPGYPLFLAVLGLDTGRIWLGQLLLGLLISVMLYWIALGTTGTAWIGFVLGALYDLIPGQILFESNLLTETLTTFLVVLTVLVFASYCSSRSGNVQVWKLLLLGFVGSTIGMVRPLFFPVTVLLFLGVWIATPGNLRRKVQALALYAIFPLLIQGGWLVYMRNHWNVLSPTAMGGYSMVQHTGGYFEYLPDEYAAVRDTYIEYRDRQVAERGVQTNAIWEAIPAISAASGLGFYELAREMGKLSWMLIREHPDLYLKNVAKGWVNFWKAPVYWKPEHVGSTALRAGLGAMAVAGRALSISANLIFLLLSAAWVISRRVRSWIRMDAVIGMSVGMVWLISIVQTFLDHGDNPRFLVPLQMLVFLTVLAGIQSLFASRRVRVSVA